MVENNLNASVGKHLHAFLLEGVGVKIGSRVAEKQRN